MNETAEPSLADFLAQVEFFSAFTADELRQIGQRVEVRHLDMGESIADAGAPADHVFVVRKGSVRLFTQEGGKDTSVGLRKAGEVIGEIAALREHRHSTSLRTSRKTELLAIPRDVFPPLLAANRAAHEHLTGLVARRSAGDFLIKLFDLRGKIEQDEIDQVIRQIGLKRVVAGQTIIEQGNREDRRLYVVRQGTVELKRAEEGKTYSVMKLDAGEVFGEKACLLRQEQPARVDAVTDAVLLVIPEQTVRLLLVHNTALRGVLTDRIGFFERELERQKKLEERRHRPLMLDLHSQPKIGERIIKRFPLVKQAEEMDCGAACLAMICKHHGIPMTLGKLREMANVTTQGATLDSLSRVGDSLGFNTRGVKCTFDALQGFDLPFIAHWEGYHYIIVYGVSSEHVWVADPGPGFRKLSVEDFEKGWSGTCLLFTPTSDMVQLAAARSPWVRFISYLRPYRKILGYLFLATFVIQLLGVVPPVIVQNILDRVIVHQDFSLLHLLLIGLVVMQVFSQLTAVMRAFLSNYMVRNLDFAMMSQFLRHTLSLPMKFFATRRTGDIFARFQENQTIRAFLTESTVTTALNILMLFIYFTILFLYNVKMTLLLMAFVVPLVVLTVAVTPRLKRYAREAFSAGTDAEAVLMETLGGSETVKGMGLERLMRMKWERRYAKSLDIQYRAKRFNILVGAVSQLLNAATTVGILWLGASLVLAGELTIGQLIAFNALTGSVMAPLLGLVGLWNQVHEAGVAMERLGDVLDIEPEQRTEDVASRVVLPDLHGEVKFENVFFRYGDAESAYVLKNISFELEPGQMVAVVGLSGSGKTTLAKLLVGFYPPTEGRIMVDGYDLTAMDLEYYRAQIGYVMQSNLLFSGSITENIAAGDENPDRRHVIEVAKIADAHGFISNLPRGYEEVVGERGVGLSGGQIQRLCIARALYRNPRMLILDEATSALDTQSESNILEQMQTILGGRTALVIAHRLSTIVQADKILVLYDGSIVEDGTHEELVDKRGMYYQLVKKQMASTS
ncbi:MAG: ABC transporter transmembrane domain-containing protein [Sedimenticolaceae bacterium]